MSSHTQSTGVEAPCDRAQALYESGRAAAAQFLESWDFQAYIAAFRSGKAVESRRDDIAAELKAVAGARI